MANFCVSTNAETVSDIYVLILHEHLKRQHLLDEADLAEAAHAACMDGGISHGVGGWLLRRLLLPAAARRPAEEVGEAAPFAAKEAPSAAVQKTQ